MSLLQCSYNLLHRYFSGSAGLALGALLLCAHPLPARSDGMLQLQYQRDSDATDNVFIDINSGLSSQATLFASIGKTRSPLAGGDFELDYWNLGLGLQLSKRFDIELELGNYGQGRDIDVDTFAAQLRWSSDHWSFSLRPQYSEIEVLLLTTPNRIRKFDSDGIGTAIGYYGLENWEFNLGYDSYRYSINPRLLSLPRIIAAISSKALIVTSGLKDDIVSADVTYLFPYNDVTLSYVRSTSAIDQSVADIYSLTVNFYQFLPYQIGIEAGTIGSDTDEASYYGGLTLGYAW